MFWTFLLVPAVKKAIHQLKGTRHMERYKRTAYIFASTWISLLVILLIAAFLSKFSPLVYGTVHIALIISNFIQLINTVLFYVAFQLLQGLELLLSIGAGHQKVNSVVITESSGKEGLSDMKVESSMKDLYSMEQESPSYNFSGISQ